MMDRTFSEVFAPGILSQVQDAFKLALEGEASSFEVRSVGGSKWYQASLKPILEDDRVIAVFGFATDITARKTAEAQVARERQFFADVLDSIHHLISVKDRDRTVLHVNESFERYTGIDREQIVGQPVDDFFTSEIAARFLSDDSNVMDGGEPVRAQRELPAADGRVGTLLTERAPLRRSDGSIYGIVTVGLDISDQIAARRQLAEAEQRFEAAFMNAGNGMALIDLDGTFLRVNPAMCELTGYPADELTGLKVADIAHPDDMAEQIDLIQRAVAGEFASYSLEKRFTRKSGETVWLVLAVSLVRDEDGRVPYLIAQTTNISARKQAEADLRDEADSDPLTELANRRLVERQIAEQIATARSGGGDSVLLLMDLDDFKVINDRHGHETGDETLRFFAGELSRQVRSTDLAARLGGDEFVVLMPDVDTDRGERIAGQLMKHFERVRCRVNGLELSCATSVGWATIDNSSESPAEVLARADRSMYEVKRARKSGR
jgi:diguanylate cyclase (GGDEF)-like protein/PAS domain S-box-containing protein